MQTGNKARILKLVSLFPGIHLRQVQRSLRISFNSVRYNVEQLMRRGDILCDKRNGYSRLYPVGTNEKDMIAYSLIRNKTTKKILLELCSACLATNKELSEKTGFARSTTSEHIHKLVEAGLVRLTLSDEGNFKAELEDPSCIQPLLERNSQESLSSLGSDLVESFEDLWDF
ncbi:MAG: winged helix-turn-helix transcriptional regulator [Nitrososphaerales archaeon]